MKYSKATNYALHTMLYLASIEPDKPVGVKQLAEKQRVSSTYLSKILAKLVKAGLIESTSGANGGYRLKANREEISFLDIIQAIEGTASLFDCCIHHDTDCAIQKVMLSSEKVMEQYLKEKKIYELVHQVDVSL